MSLRGFFASLVGRWFRGSERFAQAPTAVLILRHAEKPAAGKRSIHLSAAGLARAEALPALFGLGGGAARLPRPEAIFVPTATKRSNRPAETVAALAKMLGLTVHQEFEAAQTAELAREVLSGRYAGRVVLLCWRHGQMAALARELGAADAPVQWAAADFHSIWRLDYAEGRARTTCLSEEWFGTS